MKKKTLQNNIAVSDPHDTRLG